MRIVTLIAFVGLVVAFPTVAHAQTPTAKDHYRKGLSYYALQKYAEAALEYEQAFELAPDPALLYNAAQAHRLAGNKQRALALYGSFVRLFPGKDDGSVQRHIAALKIAIEAEGKAERQPPIDTRAPDQRNEPAEGTSKPTQAAPTAAPASSSTESVDVTTKAPPPKKSTPKWVWGVVAGGVVVVGVVLGLGLGVGLSGTNYPTATAGSATIE